MPYFREWNFDAKRALVIPEYKKIPPKLARADLLKYGRQLLEFLSDMQGAQLVHLDVRPENITLDLERDEIRVIDFETGRNLLVNGRECLVWDEDLWGGGKYMPPELDPEYCNGEYWCWEQTDSFSVGRTLEEWVEWVEPENERQSLRRAMQEVVCRLVESHPFDRWTGARALEEWKKLCASCEATVPSESQETIVTDVLPVSKRLHTVMRSDSGRSILSDIGNRVLVS